MNSKALCTFALVTTLCVLGSAQEGRQKIESPGNDGWVSMFNGRSLDGWTQKNGWATYKVQPAKGDEPAAIVGTTAKVKYDGRPSPNSFLCSVQEYGDFELEFEVKVSNELNSGVQIRSQTETGPGKSIYNTGRVNGPQVEIEASGANGAEAGYIYGEACGGWMTPQDKLVKHKHFKDGEWNKYRILAIGPNIKVWINGAMISDLTDDAKYKSHPRGFIGLQVHGIGDNPGPYTAAWRNLRIKEIKSQKQAE